MTLSIIIPCHNEEKRIGKTLWRIDSYLKEKEYKYEILVIENDSTDSTDTVLQSFLLKIPQLRIIHELRRGKGRAVKRGMLEAKGDMRLFTDADNSTDISHIDSFIAALSGGNDIVIGSRRIKGAQIEKRQPPFRFLLGKIFPFIVQMLVPLGIYDTQNGFKLFTKEAAEAIFSCQTVSNWSFDVEILALARLKGMRIKEMPIRWQNDDLSKMDFLGMLNSVIEIWKIRRNLSRNIYKKSEQRSNTLINNAKAAKTTKQLSV